MKDLTDAELCYSVLKDINEEMLQADNKGLGDIEVPRELTRAETLRNIIAMAQEELNNIENKETKNKVAKNLVLDQWN